MNRKKISKKTKKSEDDTSPEDVDTGEFSDYMDEEDEEDLEKSLTADQLNRGIERLEKALRAQEPEEDRKQELLQKSLSGSASASERAELAVMLSPPQSELREELTKSLADLGSTEPLRKALDASPILAELQDALIKSIGDVADRMQEREVEDADFRLALMKSLIDFGSALQSQNERLSELSKSVDAVSRTPAHPPTAARTGAQPLSKSIGGSSGQVDLNKIQDNIAKRIASGNRMSASGQDLVLVSSVIESGGMPTQDIVSEFGA